jgi:hypothetical protein
MASARHMPVEITIFHVISKKVSVNAKTVPFKARAH